MIRFSCPSCQTRLTVKETAAGKRGKCPNCGNQLHVPAESPLRDSEPAHQPPRPEPDILPPPIPAPPPRSAVDQSSWSSDYRVDSTSSRLLSGIRAGDQRAWERFVRMYGRLILHWCSLAGLQAADRADLLQEVTWSVSNHISSFRHDRPGDTFRGWLRCITTSRLRDYLRRQSRQPVAVDPSNLPEHLLRTLDLDSDSNQDGSPGKEGSLLAQAAFDLVRSEFEDRTWAVFWRTFADGVPAAVVAEQMGMTSAAVRKAKSRVLSRLREELTLLMNEPDS